MRVIPAPLASRKSYLYQLRFVLEWTIGNRADLPKHELIKEPEPGFAAISDTRTITQMYP
jgi:hypothetical protein